MTDTGSPDVPGFARQPTPDRKPAPRWIVWVALGLVLGVVAGLVVWQLLPDDDPTFDDVEHVFLEHGAECARTDSSADRDVILMSLEHERAADPAATIGWVDPLLTALRRVPGNLLVMAWACRSRVDDRDTTRGGLHVSYSDQYGNRTPLIVIVASGSETAEDLRDLGVEVAVMPDSFVPAHPFSGPLDESIGAPAS